MRGGGPKGGGGLGLGGLKLDLGGVGNFSMVSLLVACELIRRSRGGGMGGGEDNDERVDNGKYMATLSGESTTLRFG